MTPEGKALAGIGIALPILNTLVVVARFRARRLTKTKIRMDDWTTLLSLISVYVLNFTMVYGAFRGGFGIPPEDLLRSNRWIEWGRVYFVGKISWEFTIGIVKISALLLYRRIFVHKKFLRPIDILIALNTVWMFGNVISTIFAFTPVSAFWTGDAGPSLMYGPFFLSVDATDIVLDLATLLFPLFAVGTLQMSLKRKLAISTVFLVGFLSTIASIVRVVYRVIILPSDRLIAAEVPIAAEERFHAAIVFICTLIECDVALIAICLPTLGPLVREIKRILTSARTGSGPSRSLSSMKYRMTSLSRSDNMPLKDAHGGNGDEKMVASSWMALTSMGNVVDVEHGSRRSGDTNHEGRRSESSADEGHRAVAGANEGIRVQTTWAVTRSESG